MNDWVNIWEILGIPYTTDIGEIKRAYASRAKDCHPEDHPEEFNRLQKAYKTALQIAKNRKAYETAMEKAQKNASEETGKNTPEEPEENAPKEAEKSTSEETEKSVPEESDKGISEKPEKSAFEETEKSAFEEPEKSIVEESAGQEPEVQEVLEGLYESKPETGFSSYFDYSEIRDEDNLKKQQAKENLRKKLMYIIWNPYARNDVRLWDCFLHGQEQGEPFGDPEFRADFVRLLYQERFAGWHRDQILFFREYMEEFRLAGQPAPELQLRQWNWLLDNAGTGRDLLDCPCTTPEEQKNYSVMDIRFRPMPSFLPGKPGKTGEEQYLEWYMAYAKKNEDKLRTFYRDWVTLRKQRFEHSDAQSILWRSLYMIWNPYVRNNISMWKYFLNEKRIREMFGDRGFRLMFFRQILQARFAGWHRDQISFFWQFLADFEPDGKLPGDFPIEEWTQLFRSASKRGKAVIFSFLTRKEKMAYDNFYTREVFDGVNPDPDRPFEEQYLDWYWKYAEQNESQLTSIYENWISIRRRIYYYGNFLQALPATIAVILALLWEIFIYKPYGNDVKRYQKMHEQLQDTEEEQEEQYWKEIKQQALEGFGEIQSQLDEWDVKVETPLETTH